jgi:acetolactate synthase-1/2/3 large subunit
LTVPDTCKVASAYGLKTSRIENHSGIKEKVRKVIESNGPEICEVMVHPMLAAMPKLSSEVKPDGRIVSKPMEDLWPFLDREEFRENMIVKPLDE